MFDLTENTDILKMPSTFLLQLVFIHSN